MLLGRRPHPRGNCDGYIDAQRLVPGRETEPTQPQEPLTEEQAVVARPPMRRKQPQRDTAWDCGRSLRGRASRQRLLRLRRQDGRHRWWPLPRPGKPPRAELTLFRPPSAGGNHMESHEQCGDSPTPLSVGPRTPPSTAVTVGLNVTWRRRTSGCRRDEIRACGPGAQNRQRHTRFTVRPTPSRRSR